MSNCRDRRGRFTSCDIGERQRRHSRRRGMGLFARRKTGGAARGRRARGTTPILIETADEMKGLPRPIMHEDTGEENVYFLDGHGQRYYFKMDDVTFSEQRKIRQHFMACIPSR